MINMKKGFLLSTAGGLVTDGAGAVKLLVLDTRGLDSCGVKEKDCGACGGVSNAENLDEDLFKMY